MFSHLRQVALLFILLVACTCVLGQKIAVPSYFYPGVQWAAVASSQVGFAVINPNSGPGTAVDSSYASQVQSSQAAGVKVLGYVHTSYGTRNITQVLSDIATYYSWYSPSGIFVDEASTSCASITYYTTIYNNVKSHGGTVMINPGAMTAQCYMAVADIVLIAENTWSGYQSGWTTPTWMPSYSPSRFFHIIHSCPPSAYSSAISMAISRYAGYVYITDLVLPNPYLALPSYWAALQGAVNNNANTKKRDIRDHIAETATKLLSSGPNNQLGTGVIIAVTICSTLIVVGVMLAVAGWLYNRKKMTSEQI